MYPKKHISLRSLGSTQKMMNGAVAVEFSLLLIPLLMLALGAAEFGRAIYQYNTLVKAARDSVRHLSQLNPASNSDLKTKTESEAKCLAVHGNIYCAGQPLAPGLDNGMVKINGLHDPIYVTTSIGTKIALIEVIIENYQFNFLLDPRTFNNNGESSLTFGDIRAAMRQS